ncbi:hypothetical protein [Flavobacterium rhizosphaerae]|uniref:Uncharacterized protein n=1 Tax=Flavobacterium rhizosphaerae TaxID=3163298 RepID=A0ABW8YTK7_9FLAO
MKTIYIVLMFAAAFLALYEQSLAKPNMLIMVIAIVAFMLGLMRLMSKVPSKHNDHEEGRDEEI